MARRTPETLADYLVVAICPTLIAFFVGSLMLFLVEVFYKGEFRLRLQLVMAMFVMAIVCVARITVELGSQHAAMYSLPLAIVVGFALARFIPIHPLFNWSLMALVWWATHKLTLDSTLIDDTQDASGRGLLEEMGLDRPAAEEDATAGLPPAGSATEGTTAGEPEPATWWQRWQRFDSRPHAPGVWVVYFSLAAVPLFGIGGWFIRDPEARGRAFRLLAIYVACGLGLLVATSFLGLRRYLRQRKLQMPLEMTATWLLVGAALILAMLLVAAVLPRPQPEYSLSQVPQLASAAFRRASQWGVGPEGVRDRAQSGRAAGQDHAAAGQQDSAAKGGRPSDARGSSGGRPSGDGQAQSRPAGQERQADPAGARSPQLGEADDGRQSRVDHAGGEHAGGEPSGGDQSGGRRDSGEQQDSGTPQDSSSQRHSDDRRASSGQPASRGDPARGHASERPADAAGGQSSPAESDQDGTRRPPPAPAYRTVAAAASALASWLLGLLRGLFSLAVVIAALVAAWIYREPLLEGWRSLLDGLWRLWARAAGGGGSEVPAPAAPPVVRRPLAAFADPFASHAAGHMSWPELVRYSFAAAEAFAWECGAPRQPGQTPLEFAEALARERPALAGPLRSLATAYSELAYSPRPAARTVEPLRQLWHALGQAASSFRPTPPAPAVDASAAD